MDLPEPPKTEGGRVMLYAVLAVIFAVFLYFEIKNILAMWKSGDDE